MQPKKEVSVLSNRGTDNMDNLKDLIHQLKTVKLPDEENQLHRYELRRQLLCSKYFDQKGGELAMIIKKATVLASLVLLVGAGVFFGFINPKLAVARAAEIAKNDPQVRELMEKYGVEIKEVKLEDGKAYVLLAHPEEKIPSLWTEERTAIGRKYAGQFFGVIQRVDGDEPEFYSGSVAEIDLKANKVEKLKFVEKTDVSTAPLTEEEKAKAIELAKSSPDIKEMIGEVTSADVEITVKPMPPLKLRLEETDEADGVKVSSEPGEDKRANVIFRYGKQEQYMVMVNLTQNRVEGAATFGSINTSSGKIQSRPDSESPYPIKPKFYLEPKEGETYVPDGGGDFAVSVSGKSMEEMLKDAELISEDKEEGLKTYRLSNGEIMEVKEKDGIISVKTKTQE